MKLTKALLEKAKTAASAEELLELAEEENIKLTAAEAEKAYAQLNQSGEVSDEELGNIAGGGGCGNPSPDGEADSKEEVVFLYEIGQRVEIIGDFGSTETAVIVDRRASKGVYDSYYPWYTVTDLQGRYRRDVNQSKIQIP